MRIISGSLKNRKIVAPKGVDTRPTSAKMREALFNILHPEIEGAVFLDLFAGSGVMGIEALSRGAKRVVFVEKSYQAIKSITANLSSFNLNNQATLLNGDVLQVLERLASEGEAFDIIYADPPYSLPSNTHPLSAKVVEKIDARKLLVSGGDLFIEESRNVDFSTLTLDNLLRVKDRCYGRSILVHFTQEE